MTPACNKIPIEQAAKNPTDSDNDNDRRYTADLHSTSSVSGPTTTPIMASSSKQRPRPRRVRTRTAQMTARAPLRLFQSITSGVKKSAKLVRGNTRTRRQRSHRPRTDSRVPLDDDVTGETLPLLNSAPMRHDSGHSLRSGVHNSYRTTASNGTMNQDIDIDDIQARVLRNMEFMLRQILILIAVYLLGSYQPIGFLAPPFVQSVGYFVAVAWGTCALITSVSWVVSFRTETGADEEQELVNDVDDADSLEVDTEYGGIEEVVRRTSNRSSRGIQNEIEDYGGESFEDEYPPVKKRRSKL